MRIETVKCDSCGVTSNSTDPWDEDIDIKRVKITTEVGAYRHGDDYDLCVKCQERLYHAIDIDTWKFTAENWVVTAKGDAGK